MNSVTRSIKHIAVIFTLVACFICLPLIVQNAYAAEEVASGTCGDDLTWVLEYGVLTISGSGDMYIDNEAWTPKSAEITSVVVEDGVTSISRSAFSNLAITSVVLPSTLQYIDDNAFSSTSISSVNIPDSVTNIGSNAFYGCNNLSNISLGSKLQTIGDYAFSCTKVNCSFPDSLRIIGTGAFDNTYITGDVIIPEGVTELGFGAFQDCDYMESMMIPKTVVSVGAGFASGDIFTQFIVDDENPNYCSVDGILYDKAKTMMLSCPQGKSGSVSIVEGVKSIQPRAFYYNASLSEVNIPSTVRLITSEAFLGLGARVNIYRCSAPNISTEAVGPVWQSRPEIHVPQSSKGYNVSPWDELNVTFDISEQLIKHDYQDWIVTTAATCITDGSREKVCAGCGDKVAETIDATGHSFSVEFTVDTAPTCTAEGSKSKHCANCEEKSEVTMIDALGHDWDSGTITTEPTCTAEGVKTFNCSRCEETKTEAVTALGHTPSDPVRENDVDATCENEGSYDEVVYCSVCKEEINRNKKTVAALGHAWNEDYTVDKEATCTEEGSKSIHCSRCSETKDAETIPATGHSFSAWKTTKKTTEIAVGKQTRTCSVCGETETKTIAQLKPTLPAVKISKVVSGKKYATVKWAKVSSKNQKKIAKIQIQYCTDKSFKKNVKTVYAKKSSTSKKITKLTSKKTYYFRIRAYKSSSGKVHVSKWSSTKYAKVK